MTMSPLLCPTPKARAASTSSDVPDDEEHNEHSHLYADCNPGPASLREAGREENEQSDIRDPQTQDREAAPRTVHPKDSLGVVVALREGRDDEGPRHRVACDWLEAPCHGPVRGRIGHLRASVLHQISWRACRKPSGIVDGEWILEPALGRHLPPPLS